MLSGVQELAPSVGIARACEALGVPRSSFYQAQQPATPRAVLRPHPLSPRALNTAERTQIRELLNSQRFVDRAPRTVYAILLDEGCYLCSWRTMYRLLAADAATRE
jgi:putative transposase